MQRRDLLARLSRQAAALALGSLFGPGAAAQAPAIRRVGAEYPFTLGVASGMPRPDSVTLWTRLAPRPHEPGGGLDPLPRLVRWELAEDDHFSTGLRAGTVTALPEHAHSVHVNVRGLESDRVWFYRFLADEAASPIGRTRTAPAADAAVARLRFALASCQHYEQGWYAAHREIAARELDFVLFVGDYIYETNRPRDRVRRHEGPPPVTLEGYRARHATYKLDADLRAAHAAHPWLLIWDDHEVENDYAGEAGAEEPEDFLRRRSAAYKAYFEHQPVTPTLPPPGGAFRLHDRYSWGRLADLWLLDGRQYRSPQACDPPGRAGGRVLSGCDGLDDPGRSVFGTAQEAWFDAGLAASRAPWKLAAQGSQISGGAIDTPLGRRFFSDGWDGYPAARRRLLRSAATHGADSGVVFLGGDVHRHVAADLRARPGEPGSPVVAGEFVCSSVTSRGLTDALTALMRSSNPDIAHARSDERGYALLEIDREAARCDFRATPHPATEGAHLSSQARFAVEAGQPGVQRD
ncbi:MAG: alkaline phosphatase D family protein [Piscinibacter sp.]|nr:alkaline phosphatase D family protein [Piscinibacter sp.]